MRCLRQSTAADIAIGPFLDTADGFTAMTALTLAQADIRLKKNAAAWAQVNDATSATHEENGWYEKELDATDTDTLGVLIIAIHETGALPVWHEFSVVPANVYDSMFAADTLQVEVTSMAANTVTASALAADAVTEIQAGLATSAGLATLATAASVATVDTVVDAIKVKTDQLTFGVANTLNGNITHVNETTVNGTGTVGDEWGP